MVDERGVFTLSFDKGCNALVLSFDEDEERRVFFFDFDFFFFFFFFFCFFSEVSIITESEVSTTISSANLCF